MLRLKILKVVTNKRSENTWFWCLLSLQTVCLCFHTLAQALLLVTSVTFTQPRGIIRHILNFINVNEVCNVCQHTVGSSALSLRISKSNKFISSVFNSNSPNNDMLYFYMLKCRAEKIADQLGVIGALREDPGLVPSIHTRWLTTSCNISSRDPDAAS